MKTSLLRAFLVSLLVIAACVSSSGFDAAPKRVIFLIGDGMGPVHVEAMKIVAQPFHLDRFPVKGAVTTHSANDRVTDSGAAATALATGVKTNNRMVSVDPRGRKLPTVLEKAAAQGRATGVLTTANFFDATPAAFAAHAASRTEGGAISREMMEGPLTLIIGGGAQAFGKNSAPTLEQAAAATKRQIPTSFDASRIHPGQRLLKLFNRQEEDTDFPEERLATLAKFALDVLSSDPEGFFLVIEHEGIDTASHNRSNAPMIESLRSFNETIGVALEFARKNPDTLVIVTSDHETGGLRISGKTPETLQIRWTAASHTATAVPLFAFGPGATRIGRSRDNTSVARALFELLGD